MKPLEMRKVLLSFFFLAIEDYYLERRRLPAFLGLGFESFGMNLCVISVW